MSESTSPSKLSLEPVQEIAADRVACLSRADLLRELGQRLSRDEVDGAKQLYCRSAEDIGYELIHVVGSGALAPALVRLFVESRDYYKAAQVFETMGDLPAAAAHFALAEAYIPAADLFAQVGDVEKAAEMCEKAGSYGQAASFFSGCGRWGDAGRNYQKAAQGLEAGEAFAKAGDHKRALECLQKVGPGDPGYSRAVELLGPTLEEMGLEDLALRKYEEAVRARDGVIDDDNVGLYYRLARLCERLGDVERAKAAYVRILDHDLTYEDARERYRSLQSDTTKARPRATEPASDVPGVVVLDEDRSVVEKSLLFRGLSFEEIRSLLQLTQKVVFAKGDVLVREGEPFPGLCLIDRGEVEICMKMEEDASKVVRLTRFGPGDHFGELTVIGADRAGRIFAIAAAEGSYYVVPRDAMTSLLERSPALKAKLLENMMLALDLHLEQSLGVIKAMWARKQVPS